MSTKPLFSFELQPDAEQFAGQAEGAQEEQFNRFVGRLGTSFGLDEKDSGETFRINEPNEADAETPGPFVMDVDLARLNALATHKLGALARYDGFTLTLRPDLTESK